MILLVIVLVAVAVGYVRGGRLEGLSRVAFRGAGAALLLFGVQMVLRRGVLLPQLFGTDWVAWLWCGVALGLLALCVMNQRVPGIPLVAVGIGLNLLVVLLNGGMPVGGSLAASFDMNPNASVIEGRGAFYEVVETETVIPALGDVIPIPAPRPFRSLVSLGDLLMFLGAGVLIEESMYRGRYRPRHALGRRQTLL